MCHKAGTGATDTYFEEMDNYSIKSMRYVIGVNYFSPIEKREEKRHNLTLKIDEKE